MTRPKSVRVIIFAPSVKRKQMSKTKPLGMVVKKWDIQIIANLWFSLGFHIDHTDPSITIHLPGAIIYFGRCKQPGLRNDHNNL